MIPTHPPSLHILLRVFLSPAQGDPRVTIPDIRMLPKGLAQPLPKVPFAAIEGVGEVIRQGLP
jgi:hypothetical protein